MIQVMLVEDHKVVRAGLEELLAGTADIEVVGIAANGLEATELAAELAPDVILMDISMPELDGIEATRRIVAKDSGARIVILTSFSDRERILEALDAGAIGYLLKDAEPDELFRGIRAAAAGESPLAPKAATMVLEDRGVEPPPDELTDREREVLALVAMGEPNKLIARTLEISEATVKAHLTSVYRRIGVSSRTEAAIWARDHSISRESN
jgi:DNA-binding NarL/FixJ family response regulator